MSSVVISGDTSGAVTLAVPAVAGTNTITVPAATGTMALTSDITSSKVVQIVYASYSTYTSTNSSTYADTGNSATITPTSASNKILVIFNIGGVAKLNNTSVDLRLVRGSTEILRCESAAGYDNSSGWNRIGSSAYTYLDSPATTSATTYKTQYASHDNTAVAYVQLDPAASTITLMEVTP